MAAAGAGAEAAEEFGRAGGAGAQVAAPSFGVFGIQQIAQRVQRVVGDEARPHEFPQGGLRVAGEAASTGLMERREEGCAYLAEGGGDALGAVGELRMIGGADALVRGRPPGLPLAGARERIG